jgi:hypothetical protein
MAHQGALKISFGGIWVLRRCHRQGAMLRPHGWAEESVTGRSSYWLAISTLAASYALAGRDAEAQNATARLRRLDPELRIANLEKLSRSDGPKILRSGRRVFGELSCRSSLNV